MGFYIFHFDFGISRSSGCVTAMEFYIFQMILGFSDNLVVSQQGTMFCLYCTMVCAMGFYIFQIILGFSDNLVVSQEWRRRTSFWSPHLVTLACNCPTKRFFILFCSSFSAFWHCRQISQVSLRFEIAGKYWSSGSWPYSPGSCPLSPQVFDQHT